MFTDQPVTPGRIETLLRLVRAHPGMKRNDVLALLQPATVHQGRQRLQARETLSAAVALKLVEEDDSRQLRVRGEEADIRALVLKGLDEEVLAKTDIEHYLAPFYSFMLGSPGDRSRDEWAADFNRTVPSDKLAGDPFNPTKVSGLWRWLVYAGLGWTDPAGRFQPVPTDRIRRQLPSIFAGQPKLEDGAFMDRLATCCPELDGGAIFASVNRERKDKTCTAGLAEALVELHLEGVLRLNAPPDARGWSIAAAQPPFDGKTLRGDRFQTVEIALAAPMPTPDGKRKSRSRSNA